MSYSRFACMRTSYFLSMVEFGWNVWKLASLRSYRYRVQNMFIPWRHKTIPGLCWFTLIHNKVQDKFASCTIVIYLEERSPHWLSQCRMAIACNAHLYIQYKGCDPSNVWLGNVGGIPIFAKTHPDKVPKLSAGTCSFFFSWNCGHAK